MKLYLSGPISGKADGNRTAFGAAARALHECGHQPINPYIVGDLLQAEFGGIPPAWEDYMRADIAELMTCDAVATLHGWAESRGACIEVHLAQALGMLVQSVDAWIEGAAT